VQAGAHRLGELLGCCHALSGSAQRVENLRVRRLWLWRSHGVLLGDSSVT
jgi:hypothetical protein